MPRPPQYANLRNAQNPPLTQNPHPVLLGIHNPCPPISQHPMQKTTARLRVSKMLGVCAPPDMNRSRILTSLRAIVNALMPGAVIVVALCFATGCTTSQSPSRAIKTALTQWQPDERNNYELDPKLLAPDMKIAGPWSFTDSRYFGTDLRFSPSRDGYIAHFHAWGCTGEIALKRTATFSGGVVRLNLPVRDFWPNTYQTLYAVRIGKKDFLIPSSVAKEFETGLNPEHTVVAHLAWHVLQRKSSIPSSPK